MKKHLFILLFISSHLFCMDNDPKALSIFTTDLTRHLLTQSDITTQVSIACTSKALNEFFNNWKLSILNDETEKKKIGSPAWYYSLPGNKFDQCSQILDIYRCLYLYDFHEVTDKDAQYHQELENLRGEFDAVWNYHKEKRGNQGSAFHLNEGSDLKKTFAVYKESGFGIKTLKTSFSIICRTKNSRAIEIFLNRCKGFQKIPKYKDNPIVGNDRVVIKICAEEDILFEYIKNDCGQESIKDIIMNYLLYNKDGTMEEDNTFAYILSKISTPDKYCINFLKKIKMGPLAAEHDFMEQKRESWFKVLDQRIPFYYNFFFSYPQEKYQELNAIIKQELMQVLDSIDKNRVDQLVATALKNAIQTCAADIIRWDRESSTRSWDRGLKHIISKCEKQNIATLLKDLLNSMVDKSDSAKIPESTKQQLKLMIDNFDITCVDSLLIQILKPLYASYQEGKTIKPLLELNIRLDNDIAGKLIELRVDKILEQLTGYMLKKPMKELLRLAIQMEDSYILRKIKDWKNFDFFNLIDTIDTFWELCSKDWGKLGLLGSNESFSYLFDEYGNQILNKINDPKYTNNISDVQKRLLQELIFFSQLRKAIKASSKDEVDSLLRNKLCHEIKKIRKDLLYQAVYHYGDNQLIKNVVHCLFPHKEVDNSTEQSLQELLNIAIDWKKYTIIESIVGHSSFDSGLITSPQLLYDIIFKVSRPSDSNNGLFILNKDLLLALYEKNVDFKICFNSDISCANNNRTSLLRNQEPKKYTEEDRNFLLNLFFIQDLEKINSNKELDTETRKIFELALELAINWENKYGFIKLIKHPLFCADMISQDLSTKIDEWKVKLSWEGQVIGEKYVLALLNAKKLDLNDSQSTPGVGQLTSTVISENNQKKYIPDLAFIYFFDKDLSVLSKIARYKKYASIFSCILFMTTYLLKIQGQ